MRTIRLGAAAALLASQPVAQVKPTDARVTGVVVRNDGSPAAGVPVRVVGTDTGIRIFTQPPFVDAGTTTTDSAGAYGARLPGSYVPGRETNLDWIVTASLGAGPGDVAGPSSSFEFEVRTALHQAPPLPLWEAEPAVRVDGFFATVTAPPRLPAERASLTLFIGRPKGAQLPERRAEATFDLRLLESEGPRRQPETLAFGAVAAADIAVTHSEGRTIYHQRLASRQRTVALDAPLVPPSRGSPCTIALADGRTVARTPCPATDGAFSAPVRGPSGAVPASVTVELGGPVTADAVVARGCKWGCVIEVSADGSTWTRAPAPSVYGLDGVAAASMRPAQQVRFARVSARAGEELGVSEISIWHAPPPPAEPAPAVVPRAGSPAEGGPSGPLTAIAVVLALAAGLGVGLVARSRR